MITSTDSVKWLLPIRDLPSFNPAACCNMENPPKRSSGQPFKTRTATKLHCAISAVDSVAATEVPADELWLNVVPLVDCDVISTKIEWPR